MIGSAIFSPALSTKGTGRESHGVRKHAFFEMPEDAPDKETTLPPAGGPNGYNGGVACFVNHKCKVFWHVAVAPRANLPLPARGQPTRPAAGLCYIDRDIAFHLLRA